MKIDTKIRAAMFLTEIRTGKSPRHPPHGPLHEPREVLIDLHRHIHSPRHNHFPLPLQVSAQRSPRHTFGSNPAHRPRTHALQLISVNRILTERGPHVSRTNRQYVNPIFLQLHARRLAHRIQRKLGRTVSRMKWDWNMPRHARYIDDHPPALLPYHGN